MVDGCCLRIYREALGGWQLYRELKASDFTRRPAMFSPEILVRNGQSFVVMQLAKQRTGDSEIWMVGVDPLGQRAVMLSDPGLRGLARAEPEWMVTPQGVFVYVSASSSGSRFALHRLKTPLVVSH